MGQGRRGSTVEPNLDKVYEERDRVIALLARMALDLGWDVRVTKTTIEGWDPEWQHCVYIQSPAGQFSWHFHERELFLFVGLPHGPVVWDEHTTEQKYASMHALSLLMDNERIQADTVNP